MGEVVPARTSHIADPTSPIPSHGASIVVTSTVRVNITYRINAPFGHSPMAEKLPFE